MSPQERRAIEILIHFPRTPDRYLRPVIALADDLGWDTLQTRKYVEKLLQRHLIVGKSEWRPKAQGPIQWWERGDALRQREKPHG